MSVDQETGAPRPLRADARRNRDAILQAAREAFELEGVLASLDGIAARAGVGNATLYRNFPTREDLLAAVMESDLEDARAEAKRLVAELAPRRAFAEWLIWLTWRLRIWHDLPHCVAEASASSTNPAVWLLMQLTADLLASAQAAGVADRAVEAREVFELATAVSWAIDRFGDNESAARRRAEVATAGLFT
jgi:AcrR family transcriptional regulator